MTAFRYIITAETRAELFTHEHADTKRGARIIAAHLREAHAVEGAEVSINTADGDALETWEFAAGRWTRTQPAAAP